MHARLEGGKLIFDADSDALLVRGLVALLVRMYSNATPAEILHTPPDFVKEIGLESKLSPSRANGLVSMIKQNEILRDGLSSFWWSANERYRQKIRRHQRWLSRTH